MPLSKKAYDHFGGRKPDQRGSAVSLETDLVSWASFSPAQVQAFLVAQMPTWYAQTKDSRKSLLRSKELFGYVIKRHNQKYKTGQEQYITVLKVHVSPMQLLVQHSFCKAKVTFSWQCTSLLCKCNASQPSTPVQLKTCLMQGLEFNATEWAMEFFDFAGQKAAEKLQKYLHLEEVQHVIPSFDSVSHAEQLAQVTVLAAEQAGEWLSQLLQDLSAQDIQQAATQLAETAVSTIEMFQQNISHGLLEWADAQQAPQHLDAFLGKLGLEPHQHDSVAKAVVYSVYERSSDGIKQEQLATLTEVCVAGPSIPLFRCSHSVQCCVCYAT